MGNKKTLKKTKKPPVPAKKAAPAKKAPAPVAKKLPPAPTPKKPALKVPEKKAAPKAPQRPTPTVVQEAPAPAGNYRKQRKWAPGKLQHLLSTTEASTIRREIGSATRGALTATELVAYLLKLESVIPPWRESRMRRARGEYVRGPRDGSKRKLSAEEAKAAAVKPPAPVTNPKALLDHAADGGLLEQRGPKPKPPAPAAKPVIKFTGKKKAA